MKAAVYAWMSPFRKDNRYYKKDRSIFQIVDYEPPAPERWSFKSDKVLMDKAIAQMNHSNWGYTSWFVIRCVE